MALTGAGLVAGVDEAGRGPLAGPVVAAAAILTPFQEEELLALGLTDSKKLTLRRRAPGVVTVKVDLATNKTLQTHIERDGFARLNIIQRFALLA